MLNSVLVTGGSGFVARAVLPGLAAPRLLSRSGRVPDWAPEGSIGVAQDLAAGPPPLAALEGVEAVLNLAGEPIAGHWSAEKKALIRSSRVDATRNLVQALGQLERRPKVLVSASAVGYFGDCGEREVTEQDGPGKDYLAQVCQDWEAAALDAEKLGIRVVVLRFGLVAGPEGGVLEKLLMLKGVGLVPSFGLGNQWWSWIGCADLGRIIRRALADDGMSGIYNATSPRPLRCKDFVASVASRNGSRVVPMPSLALKLALGEGAQPLLCSQRVLPARLTELGFDFYLGSPAEAVCK